MSKCSSCLGPISKCGHTETLAYIMSDGSEGGCWACEGAPDDATPDPEFAEKIAEAERPVLPVPPITRADVYPWLNELIKRPGWNIGRFAQFCEENSKKTDLADVIIAWQDARDSSPAVPQHKQEREASLAKISETAERVRSQPEIYGNNRMAAPAVAGRTQGDERKRFETWYGKHYGQIAGTSSWIERAWASWRAALRESASPPAIDVADFYEEWINKNERSDGWVLRFAVAYAKRESAREAPSEDMFWPPANATEEHLYEIRNGKVKEYVMEHVQALQSETLEALRNMTEIAQGLLRGECYDRAGPKFLAHFHNAQRILGCSASPEAPAAPANIEQQYDPECMDLEMEPPVTLPIVERRTAPAVTIVSNGYPLNKLAEEIESTVFFREIDVIETGAFALQKQIANFVRSKVFATAPAATKEK